MSMNAETQTRVVIAELMQRRAAHQKEIAHWTTIVRHAGSEDQADNALEHRDRYTRKYANVDFAIAKLHAALELLKEAERI
jgi:hypothetical protein